jgi:hypothetical protein
MLKRLTIILLTLSSPITAKTTNELQYRFETAGMAGTGAHAPFWHTSNRQGLPSIKTNNCYMHHAALGSISNSKGLNFDYGLDLGAGAGLESNLFVHQLYLDIDYKWLGLSAGMKERWSDKNPKLSSGALTWSGNSKPIPELRAGIPEYVRVPILGSWFSVKGHVGYGRLTDDTWRKDYGGGSYTEDILFHSKSLFVRFGDYERFPLQVTLGLEMNNLFGGVWYSGGNVRIFPSDAAAYWTALFPFHKIEQQGIDDGDNVGSWHLNFDYSLNDWHFGAYYEHYYEDHSSMLGIEYKNNTEGEKGFIFYGFRRNWMDGLFGIEINAPEGLRFFKNAVFEFLNTKGLSGPLCHSVAFNTDGMAVVEEIDGRDDMYNHNTYDSYTHHGYAIGNPVLISPVYYGSDRFRSNRVQMFHLGVDGGITRCIDYRLLATTTQHWGCYGAPLKEVERVTSVMIECSYSKGGAYDWRFTLSGAMDFDSAVGSGVQVPLLGNGRGVMVTISKTWKVL